MRKLNRAGLELIKSFESCVLHVYADAVGLPTIGVGHLVKSGEYYPALITQQEADMLLQKDLSRFCEAVSRSCSVLLNDNQFAALVSLAFNIGEGNFERSSLLRKLNSKDYAGAAREFGKWNRAGGRILNGLVRRRTAEVNLFRSPVSPVQVSAQTNTTLNSHAGNALQTSLAPVAAGVATTESAHLSLDDIPVNDDTKAFGKRAAAHLGGRLSVAVSALWSTGAHGRLLLILAVCAALIVVYYERKYFVPLTRSLLAKLK